MSWSDRKRAENMTTTSFFKRQRTISRGVWGDMSSRRALGYLARSLVEVLEDDEQREAQHQMNQQLMMQMLAAAQGHAGCGAGGCRPPMRPMLPGPGMPGPGMLMPPPSAGGLTMTMQQVHVAPAEGLRPVAMAMPHHGHAPPPMPCPSGHPPHGHAPAPMPSQCHPPHHHVPPPMVSPPSHVAAHGVSTPGDTASTESVTVASSPHGHLRPRTPPRRPPAAPAAAPAAAGDDEMEEVLVEPEPTLPGAKRLPLRSDPGAAAAFDAESERRRAAEGKPASSRPTGPATAETSDSSNDDHEDEDDDDDAGPPPPPAPGRVTSVNRYSTAPAAWSKAAAPASRPKAPPPGSASSMESSAAAGPLEDPRRRRKEPGHKKRSRSDLLQWACFF